MKATVRAPSGGSFRVLCIGVVTSKLLKHRCCCCCSRDVWADQNCTARRRNKARNDGKNGNNTCPSAEPQLPPGWSLSAVRSRGEIQNLERRQVDHKTRCPPNHICQFLLWIAKQKRFKTLPAAATNDQCDRILAFLVVTSSTGEDRHRL